MHLAKLNVRNFLLLSEGHEVPGLEGLRGKNLDYGLVRMEQSRLGSFTKSHFARTDLGGFAIGKHGNIARNELNLTFNLFRRGQNQSVQQVLNQTHPNGNFDIFKYKDRVTLGHRLIDQRY